MVKNPKNREACDLLAAAISEIKSTGEVYIRNPKPLIRAYRALLAEPAPCPDDCLWRKEGRYQKCQHCARHYRKAPDLYERG